MYRALTRTWSISVPWFIVRKAGGCMKLENGPVKCTFLFWWEFLKSIQHSSLTFSPPLLILFKLLKFPQSTNLQQSEPEPEYDHSLSWEASPLSTVSPLSSQTQRLNISRAQRFDVPAGNCLLISLCSSWACCGYTTHQQLMNPTSPSAASEERWESWWTTCGEWRGSSSDQMFTEWGFCAEREQLFVSDLQEDVSEMQMRSVQRWVKGSACLFSEWKKKT